MAYEECELQLIDSFAREVKKGLIDPINYDIKNNKANMKYSKYINDIAALKAKEHTYQEFKNLNYIQTLSLTREILIILFGSKVEPIIYEYFSRLQPNSGNSILDGITLTLEDKETHQIERIVCVPSLTKSSTIVSLVHEFIHFYFSILNINFHKKRYYEEIFSIYAEKVACHILDSYQIDRDFARKIEETRLEAITWHYKTNLPMLDEIINKYKMSKAKSKSNIMCMFQALSLESEIPILRQPNGVMLLKQYYQNLADSYGIGYLYAESLYNIFLEDKSSILSKTQSLIAKECNINDVLSYYGINASNQKTYDIVGNRLSKLKR